VVCTSIWYLEMIEARRGTSFELSDDIRCLVGKLCDTRLT
jgi:hypothetical protein